MAELEANSKVGLANLLGKFKVAACTSILQHLNDGAPTVTPDLAQFAQICQLWVKITEMAPGPVPDPNRLTKIGRLEGLRRTALHFED